MADSLLFGPVGTVGTVITGIIIKMVTGRTVIKSICMVLTLPILYTPWKYGANGANGGRSQKGGKMQKCQKCGHSWIRRLAVPGHCPKCRSVFWNGRADRRGRHRANRRRGSKYGIDNMRIDESRRLPALFGAECGRRVRAIEAWARRNGQKLVLGDNFSVWRVK